MTEPNMPWWYSDDEELWYGPYTSREEATEEGRDMYSPEGFFICQAENGQYRLNVFDRILNEIDEANEDLTDSEGSGVVFDVTKKLEQELIGELTDTLQAWVARHGLDMQSWAFGRQSKSIWIESEEPTDE